MLASGPLLQPQPDNRGLHGQLIRGNSRKRLAPPKLRALPDRSVT